MVPSTSQFAGVDATVKVYQLLNILNEYQFTIRMVFLDYEKAFDLEVTWSIPNPLSNCRIDHKYTALIQNMYNNATCHVLVQ